jgi:hypothetical protein
MLVVNLAEPALKENHFGSVQIVGDALLKMADFPEKKDL